jgi:hypothetical protein
MRTFIMLCVSGLLSLGGMQAFAADPAPKPVIPCDEPGSTPGGTTPLDHTTAPCDTGVINDIGNTSVTSPEAPGQKRLPARSQTKQAPPPHNPNPQPQTHDK